MKKKMENLLNKTKLELVTMIGANPKLFDMFYKGKLGRFDTIRNMQKLPKQQLVNILVYGHR
jgi:hypothetical protein